MIVTKRSTDRLIVGALAGLAGNAAKLATVELARRTGWTRVDGPQKAAGMLLAHTARATPTGRLVGYLSDAMVAIVTGVGITYGLSMTGGSRAALKGAIIGDAMWSFGYGALASLGASRVAAATPREALTEFIGHTIFGAVSGTVATCIGDPGLFDGTVPLTSSRPN